MDRIALAGNPARLGYLALGLCGEAAKTSKQEPHRAQKEPWADHHARHGQQVAAFEVAGKWQVMARPADEKGPGWVVRVQNLRGDPTVTRIRVYNRGQKCTWDSLDGGAP